MEEELRTDANQLVDKTVKESLVPQDQYQYE